MESMYLVAVQRDWFDCLATGATLLVSVIAVIIAVGTARRQNKIALFEKRFLVLQYLGKVLRFSDEISPEKLEGENLGNEPELIVWTITQLVEEGNIDDISFVPYPGKKQKKVTKEAVRRDVHILRKQLSTDLLILTQGCPLFPEPIRSELEWLKESYMKYVLFLLAKYGDIDIEVDSHEQLKKNFLFYSKRYKNDSKLMKSILRQLKL